MGDLRSSLRHRGGGFVLVYVVLTGTKPDSSLETLDFDMANDSRKKVAVVGAGVCGLAAARHLADPAWGFDFTVFEMTNSVGGTWVYTDKTGTDEYGLPIHSSMYKSLRTNLPKEAMMFPDFPHTKQGVSYLNSHEILQYLDAYADHFNVRSHIKFRHYVKEVKPEGSGWRLLVRDVKAGKDHSCFFDAVIISNGHYSAARYARIAGLEHFKGRLFHSHNYREPAPFRGQRVLIIGAGPSGIDMGFDLSAVTDTVALSHHTDYASKLGFPPNVILKPDVDRVLEDGKVLFKDGTSMEFDVISFCTGYVYTYPFLSKECGITVDDNYVTPLYNSAINIHHPTMAIFGIFKIIPIFYLTDLQVRYFLKTLINPELLPSKDEMFKELRMEEQAFKESGVRKADYHNLGEKTPEYMKKICKAAGLAPMPEILLRIFFHGYEKIFSDFKNFRNNFYKIIDEDNFTVVDLREITAKPVEHIHNNPSCRCGTIDSTREIY